MIRGGSRFARPINTSKILNFKLQVFPKYCPAKKRKKEATPIFELGNFKYEAYISDTNQDFKQKNNVV